MLKTEFSRRNSAVAGIFYPRDPRELAAKIDNLLATAQVIFGPGNLQILLVPHAGIDYSGAVAAAGFKQVQKKCFTKIILLGASHYHWFNYAAIFPPGIWETPLGEVKIAKETVNKIVNEKEKIVFDPLPHREEHCLEMELIFLQKALSNFQIAPILLSQAEENLIESLAKKIASLLDSQTLLVISSDLSHYPNFVIANKVDRQTISAILTGKKEIFEQTLQKLENHPYPNLDTCACGESAIRVGLRVAEISKNVVFKKIKYTNSGEVTGEKNRVVGYAAIGGWKI
ncbi:MAG: AmmeMemoRadiSam system protein B [Microgenomates group bacterium]